jgi:hypothetical protein
MWRLYPAHHKHAPKLVGLQPPILVKTDPTNFRGNGTIFFDFESLVGKN